jgi:hypothetical protein
MTALPWGVHCDCLLLVGQDSPIQLIAEELFWYFSHFVLPFTGCRGVRIASSRRRLLLQHEVLSASYLSLKTAGSTISRHASPALAGSPQSAACSVFALLLARRRTLQRNIAADGAVALSIQSLVETRRHQDGERRD